MPTGFLLESIAEADFQEKFVYKKYANKSTSALLLRRPC